MAAHVTPASGPTEIFVVEDSLTQKERLKHALEQHGYRVQAACNGVEALALLSEHKPDLIISDVAMPEMDGYQLAERIKANERLKDIPLILLTSLADPHDIVRGLLSGADNFITKPYDDAYLLSRVQYILASRELRRTERVQMGVELRLGEQRYFITSERQQILDLLISTYETAVQKNQALIKTQQELQALNEHLEEIVQARTAALTAEIEERKRAEAEVHRLNIELEQRVVQRTAQLEAANWELETFSYSVSHDLRAPLRVINGFSQAILEDDAGGLSPEGHNYLRRIGAAAQRMAELIDALLALSRVTRSEIRHEIVNLSALAESIADDLQRSRPDRQVAFHSAAGLSVEGDARLLRVALENLLGNAWKFTSKRDSARIEFGAMTQPGGARAYFVRDNGAGFDQAYAGKLFGAFQRIHAADEFEGTGIGLATVQRIVHRHGGRVWAEGLVEAGATFYFTLGAG